MNCKLMHMIAYPTRYNTHQVPEQSLDRVPPVELRYRPAGQLYDRPLVQYWPTRQLAVPVRGVVELVSGVVYRPAGALDWLEQDVPVFGQYLRTLEGGCERSALVS